MQLLVRLSQSSSSITFFPLRERELKGSSLIVALVSLFSFLKATKWIAFHSSRSDVSTVSIISQLSYGSSRLRSARPRFRDWSVSLNHIADPRSYNIQRQYAIFQELCFKVFLAPSLCFVWDDFCSGVFAFIYIIYRNESKLLKTVFKTYGNIYIMRQFKWGIMIILPYFLSNGVGSGGWGWGVGENDKRSYLNRKCRTMEYSLNPWSFTLAGFYELLETRQRVLL